MTDKKKKVLYYFGGVLLTLVIVLFTPVLILVLCSFDLVKPNTRQERINQYNEKSNAWITEYADNFIKEGNSTFREGENYLEEKCISLYLDNFYEETDKPEAIKATLACFSKIFIYGKLKFDEERKLNISITFKNGEKEENYPLFYMTKDYYTGEDGRSNCIRDGGVFQSWVGLLFQDNCYFYHHLQRICFVTDNLGNFLETGCYKNGEFTHYENGIKETQTLYNYTVYLEVRSVNDPSILYYSTNGFGEEVVNAKIKAIELLLIFNSVYFGGILIIAIVLIGIFTYGPIKRKLIEIPFPFPCLFKKKDSSNQRKLETISKSEENQTVEESEKKTQSNGDDSKKDVFYPPVEMSDFADFNQPNRKEPTII